jgi:hypothetical protein
MFEQLYYWFPALSDFTLVSALSGMVIGAAVCTFLVTRRREYLLIAASAALYTVPMFLH